MSAPSAVAQAGGAVAQLRIVRQVLVTRGAAGDGAAYAQAHDRQEIASGQGVRTLKRSQAEVDFHDGSILRVNERSDLIVEDTPALHNVHLNGGFVWVRDGKGAHTQVETPSATAVARGTTFTVQTLPSGATVFKVFDGSVDVRVGNKTVTVGAGQEITVASNGATPPIYMEPDAASPIPGYDLPVGYGGGTYPWYLSMVDELGIGVTSGSTAILDLRTSSIGEALQELGAAGPSNGSSHNPFAFDPFQLNEFFDNAQSTLVSDIKASGETTSQFGAANANETLAQAGFTAQQISNLHSLGITTVGQAVEALSVNGVNLNVTASSKQQLVANRSVYDFSQLHGEPDYDYRVLDQANDSLAFVGVGAALAIAADAENLKFPLPTLSGQAFGFLNDPDLLGGRADLDGYISDKTHYQLEGNAIRLLSGSETGWYTKPDSVAVVTQNVGDGFSVFAGRRRFYDGPVFQDAVSSQLIADRYTGAGFSYKADGIRFEGAYLYDDNPDVVGAQHGALGSFTTRAGAGTFGVNYLKVPDVGSGTGVTADAAYPVLPGTFEAYTEVGKGPDDASLQSYGGYFPGIYQKTDFDLFVEYGYHEHVGHAISIILSRDIKKTLSVRAYSSFTGGSNVTAGLGAIYKFSTR